MTVMFVNVHSFLTGLKEKYSVILSKFLGGGNILGEKSLLASSCFALSLSPLRGTGSVLESEGNDRADINLPGQQLTLLQEAASSAQGIGWCH